MITDLEEALTEVKKIATDINTTVAQWEAHSKVVAIQEKLGHQVSSI